MKTLTAAEIYGITGGIDRGYSKTPGTGKYVKATISCDSGSYWGCETSCNGVGQKTRVISGTASCAVDHAMMCYCHYTPADNNGCSCAFEELQPSS